MIQSGGPSSIVLKNIAIVFFVSCIGSIDAQTAIANTTNYNPDSSKHPDDLRHTKTKEKQNTEWHQGHESFSDLTNSSCEENYDCREIESSFCDFEAKLCRCKPDYPVTDFRHCYKESKYEEFCLLDIQCQRKDKNTRCNRDFNMCECQPRYLPKIANKGQVYLCTENIIVTDTSAGAFINPTLFGIMGGLALMFVVMCVVLRLFAKEQFTNNRTIFNTPNPRLMNVSLLKESKFFGEERKGKFVPRNTRRISSSVLMAAAAAAAAHLADEPSIREEVEPNERVSTAGDESKKRLSTGRSSSAGGGGCHSSSTTVEVNLPRHSPDTVLVCENQAINFEMAIIETQNPSAQL